MTDAAAVAPSAAPSDGPATASAGVSGSGAEAAVPRVLSIQSHVVHGYVGSKCAVFPLQLLGLEVDPVHSVQFSNHTGYPTFKGSVFDGQQLQALVDGMEANGLLKHTHLLTGYIGSLSLLEMIVDVLRRLRQHSGDVTYVCDPVMGDEGRLYVRPETVDAYVAHIVPLASVLLPNQYEAELLTGRESGSISTVALGLEACAELMERGPHTVVITSLNVAGDPDHITLVAATRQPQAAGPRHQRLTMRVPKIRAYFTGTGDLLAALLLAWMHRHPGDLATALDKAIGGLQAVLTDTAAHCGPAALAADRTAEVCRARELRLITNQRHLLHPPASYSCQPVDIL